ncbi:MAG TPA: questin oxidase family protein [Polyangiaceae bacterium]|nr:questin oxidase family protein [Polyangiaceae bacterium]
MDARRRELTRRTLLAEVSIAGALAPLGCRTATRETPKAENSGLDVPRAALGGATEVTRHAPDLAAADVLDEALERLQPRGPAYAGGLANHAPMVAESLVVLGRGDAVSRWVDAYAPRLEAWPRSGGHIARGAWADALGKNERVTDWREFFTEELANGSFRDVLTRWLPRLSAGISGSAAHGIIRVAHVVRALAVRQTAPRLRELAAALAYAASSFHRLPDESRTSGKLTVVEALDRLEMVALERRGQGSIVDRLAPLGVMPSFAGAADLVDLSGDPAATLSDITRVFARVYCANAAQRDGRIARIHAITGASALRPLLPHLPLALHRPLLRHVWQLDAAVYVTHATRGATAPPIESFATVDDLVAAAIDSGDEHAIKLTEVSLREDAAAPDPAYGKAAAHWVRASLPS